MKAKELRNSILQLAVQGKLAPQDQNDEPAFVLLDRLALAALLIVAAIGSVRLLRGHF